MAMECFFFEWYPDRDDEGSFGRVHVTNNTEAIEKSMKEGGVSSSFPTCQCISMPAFTHSLSAASPASIPQAKLLSFQRTCSTGNPEQTV